MKYLVGIERKDYMAGYMEKEVEARDFGVDDNTHVLYFYGENPNWKVVAAFHEWQYVKVADEEA